MALLVAGARRLYTESRKPENQERMRAAVAKVRGLRSRG